MIELQPLSDEEYRAFAAAHVLEYARQLVNAGEATAADGEAAARLELEELLDDRLRGAAGHRFWKGLELVSRATVGWLWIGPAPPFLGAGHERTRWLAQLTVDERQRRRGYGRALLSALESQLRQEGVEQIWLRVFHWNQPARALYESLGYERVEQFATDAHLRKRIG